MRDDSLHERRRPAPIAARTLGAGSGPNDRGYPRRTRSGSSIDNSGIDNIIIIIIIIIMIIIIITIVDAAAAAAA